VRDSTAPNRRTSPRRAPRCLGTRSDALLWNEPPKPPPDIPRRTRERPDRDGPPPSHTTRTDTTTTTTLDATGPLQIGHHANACCLSARCLFPPSTPATGTAGRRTRARRP
jgi:hypothetical protein